MRDIWQELQRRNVVRMSIAYCIFAWVVAQVADLVFESFAAPDWVMQVLLVVLAIGFIAVVIFSWLFEWSPEGLQRDHDARPDPDFQAKKARGLNALIIIVLLIAIAVLVMERSLYRASPQSTETTSEIPSRSSIASIAVLPFEDLSPESDQAYFADGIAEELLNALLKVDGLRVVSRTSSFAFKERQATVPEIASLLQVDHIVTGSVRKAGNDLRISARLIDVRSDTQLWGESYAKSLQDVFEIQQDIARRVAGSLRRVIGAGDNGTNGVVADQPTSLNKLEPAQLSTTNVDALELYWRGRYLWHARGQTNIETAIDLFEQALLLDSRFAEARAALASAHMTLPLYSGHGSNRVEFMQGVANAERHALRALDLDDTLAEALAVMGDVARAYSRWQQSERYYRQALELEPDNVTAVMWYSEFLGDVGRLDAQLEYALRAAALNPLSPGANANLAGAYLVFGDCENAASPARAAADLGNGFGHVAPVICQLANGDLLAAAASAARMEAALDVPEQYQMSQRLTDYAGGEVDSETFLRPFKESIMSSTDSRDDDMVVPLLVHLGDTTAAIDAIARPRDSWAGAGHVLWIEGLKPIREHPRFAEVLHASGLLNYFQATNRWPDGCEPDGKGIRCIR